jgi:hypothetical protein
MRLLWVVVPAFLASLAAAQTPSVLTLTLASADGRTQFRQGEAIPLQLQFQSETPGKYGVWQTQANRLARKAEFDNFTVEPAAGTADPLADSFLFGVSQAVVGRAPEPAPINGTPVTVDLYLNEWIAFRKPGRYQVSLETTRLVPISQPNTRLPMKSVPLEIEILPADPAWQAAELKRASAVLDIPDTRPRVGQRGPSFQEMETGRLNAEAAARSLRFLETPEAARALVRYVVHGPMYAQPELRAAFFATPCRKELIAALNEAVQAPDVPIVQDVYFSLQQFEEIEKIGPMPQGPESTSDMARWMREVELPYRDRAKPVAEEVTRRLTAALEHKRGEALAISLATVGGTGSQLPSPPLRKALLANLTAMPEPTQSMWLTSNWPRIAAPDAAPALKEMASGSGGLRDFALLRLMELDPAAARPIALDRIRRADFFRDAYHNERVLLSLPDQTLPELDDVLIANAEHGLFGADLLLGRYASAAVAGRVKALLDRTRGCNAPLMAYLFRVDPENATGRMAQLRANAPCLMNSMQGNEDLLMSTGLEQELIRELDGALPQDLNGIATVLQNAGSAAAKKHLLNLVLHYPAGPQTLATASDSARLNWVTYAPAWLPTAEDFDALRAACQTDPCRHRIDTLRTQLSEPIPISLSTGPPMGYTATVGPYMLRSAEQVKDKISQFPKGTSFCILLSYPESWWAEQRSREYAAILSAAGMKRVDPPPRPVLR